MQTEKINLENRMDIKPERGRESFKIGERVLKDNIEFETRSTYPLITVIG